MFSVLLREKSSLPSSSFSVSCALSCFFPPLTGLYWNKSLVTHTAAFLWVSQANFDTLIMISLSLSGPFLCPTQTSSLLKPWPPSFPSPRTVGRAIHHCESCLSLGDAWGEGSAGQGVKPGPLANLCPKTANSEPDQRSAFLPRACWNWQLETRLCSSYLPPSQICALPLTSCLISLCLFQPFSSPLAPYRASAGHARRRQQRMAGGEKEGGREADACDSVGAVMRVPTTEKQSVRPEHTDHSHAHMHKTARE